MTRDSTNEIVAVGAPMSAVPCCSRLWSTVTTNGARLVTWGNFALARDTNTPVSAQIELRSTGDFVVRSNEVETVCRRVDPDDYDGDGWQNDDDGDPYCRDEPWDDFWQELPEGANTNAYCWIEIRPRWNAEIVFCGDGPSDLTDPWLWGSAGKTYRVWLLIGKTYTMASSRPVEVVGRSSPSIEIDGNGTSEIEVVWPVTMSALESNGNGFRMVVRPSGLGGLFHWTDSCCTVYGTGLVYRYGCDENCRCSGCCAQGYYEYEGFRLGATGGSCGCSPGGPGHGEGPDNPSAVGVSVSFSKRAIIFEDSYANTTNDIAPWNSTATELTCRINGGPSGGYVQVVASGDGNLIQYTGQPLPYCRTVAPDEQIEFTNRYKATVASTREDDIEVTATFVENETGWVDECEAKATAVRVELTPEKTINGCLNRHKWGVCERILCQTSPVVPSIRIEASNGADMEASVTGQSSPTLVCPDFASDALVAFSAGGVTYTPQTSSEPPVALRFNAVRQLPSGLASGVPGGAGMTLDVHILPEDVSFMEIRMRETPSNQSDIDGYFQSDVFSQVWYHNRKRGAGTWHLVGLENFFFTDTAAMMDALITPCSTGHIFWTIPIDWKRNSGPNGLEHRLITIQQKFEMNALGTLKVSKFGYWVERALDGVLNRSEGVLP